MSLGSSNMAGNTLGTAFSLLFLASITQGFKDAEVFHYESVEAVVGQSVSLPCTIRNITGLKIASIEWKKKTEENENTKLALYSPSHGLHLFRPNVTIKTENDTNFPLYISEVTKWDSGIYICNIASFPLGSLRCDTELKIEDVVQITCDVNSTVEVQSGENVTIHCTASANDQYRWTKNKNLVSEKETLELWQVTDAHAGVYTLTVNTGSKSLHKEFNITVLTVTTILTTGLGTVSPQTDVTTEGLINSTDNSPTTSPTTGLSTTDTSVTWTMSMGTDVTDHTTTNSSNLTITTEESITLSMNNTHIGVTSSTPTHADTYQLLNSTTLSYSSTVFSPTQEMASDEMRNESTTHILNPDNDFSIMPEEYSTLGNITENSHQNPTRDQKTNHGIVPEENQRSHLLVFIMVPVLVLIVVVGFLYRRHIIKQRMDLPPPFKPPPPPVKYVGPVYRQNEISAKSFPISRCNSVAFV